MPEEKTKPAVSQQDHPGIVDLIAVKIQRGERRVINSVIWHIDLRRALTSPIRRAADAVSVAAGRLLFR